MNTHDQTLAARAAEYFAARDKVRKQDRRNAKRMDAIRDSIGAFEYEGQKIFSIAHLETMRPGEPMTAAELQDAIERLQRGNALLVEEFPQKVAAFEDAMQRAQMHFAARDEARKAAGIPAAADDDDARWQAIEELEIGAWSAKVETLGDVAGFLRLLQDHFALMGNVDDFVIESRLAARLGEAITLLNNAQQ